MKATYDKATLNSSKLQTLGFQSEADFNKSVYTKAASNLTKARITGNTDFKLDKTNKFKVTTGIAVKIPIADSYTMTTLHKAKSINTKVLTFSNMIKLRSTGNMASLSTAQKLQAVKLVQKDKTKAELVQEELLSARNTIMTKAFVDTEFADEFGLGL